MVIPSRPGGQQLHPVDVCAVGEEFALAFPSRTLETRELRPGLCDWNFLNLRGFGFEVDTDSC